MISLIHGVTTKTPCTCVNGVAVCWKWKFAYRERFIYIREVCHTPVVDISGIFCKRKYCTFIATYSVTYILFPTGSQGLYAHCLWRNHRLTDR